MTVRDTIVGLLVLFSLVACGAPSQTLTAQRVLDDFTASGITIADPIAPPRDASSPLPNSYTEHMEFTIPELGDAGGQVFVCDTKQNCDALYAYFDALKALAGPYLYQSPNGRVVVQLNSGLTPDAAAKYEAVVKTFD